MHYVEIPLTGIFVHSTNIAEYLSANCVSFIGLLFAFLAARMFYSPSYKYNVLGVVFFKIRDFFDSVDGEVNKIKWKSLTIEISVWPDLAKFRHFGKIFKGNFSMVYLLLAKMLNLLGQIFIDVYVQMLINKLVIWSHWMLFTFWLHQQNTLTYTCSTYTKLLHVYTVW